MNRRKRSFFLVNPVSSAKSQQRLLAVSNIVRYYQDTGRTLTAANIHYDPVVRNFQQQYKGFQERANEDPREVPKITKGLPVLKWAEAFDDHLMRVIGARNIPLLCCADLNITGCSAGTLFFQKNPDISPAQVACLQLGHIDKVRVVQLSESEIEGLGHVLSTNWKYGVFVNNKYGFDVTREEVILRTLETTNSAVCCFKLVIHMLVYGINGWSQVLSLLLLVTTMPIRSCFSG